MDSVTIVNPDIGVVFAIENVAVHVNVTVIGILVDVRHVRADSGVLHAIKLAVIIAIVVIYIMVAVTLVSMVSGDCFVKVNVAKGVGKMDV